MACAQWSEYNEAVRIARKSKIDNLHFNHSNFYITINYTQNLALLYSDDKHPSDIYYYSPLRLHVFSLVDHSAPNDYLYTFIYYEGEDKKGRNNVASMLYQYIIHYIVSTGWSPGINNNSNSYLIINCDNHSG